MTKNEKQFLLINLTADESYTFGETDNENILLMNRINAGIKAVSIIIQNFWDYLMSLMCEGRLL